MVTLHAEIPVIASNSAAHGALLGSLGEPQNRFQGRDTLFGGGWSTDGSRIATTGGYGLVRIWDSSTGDELLHFQPTTDYGPLAFWSPDGSKIATCSIPQVLQIWDAANGEPILGGYVNNTADLSFGDSMDMCIGSSWSPKGDRILTAIYGEGGATIWDAHSGEKILVYAEHTGGLLIPTWSPNGRRVATPDVSGVIKIWDTESGATLLSYTVPFADYLYQLAWSPDGTRLVGVGLLPSVEIHRVWQSTQELIDYARECCVFRDLTEAERAQFGLK
jgi:WD40 repeat protein